MFRYIALSWDPANTRQAQAAACLDQQFFSRAEWQPALRLSTLRVYTAGTHQGVNQIYPLPSTQGVVVGRLFRRNEPGPRHARDLELTATEGARIVHSDGQALVQDYWGRYVAFLPSRTGEGRVLRDPSGTLPCCHMQIDGVDVVFSWLEDLYALFPGRLVPPVNWEAIAGHLIFGRLESRETALHGVTQIIPGELTPLRHGAGRRVTLWSAADVARRPVDHDPAAAAGLLRRTVETCAQGWATCYGPILMRLSGGVDSAILLGSLRAGVPPERITCLNYHSTGSDSDERRFARLAAGQAGARLIERERDSSFSLDAVLDVLRTPTPGSYVGRLGTGRTDAETAAACGAAAMFTGAGGDQLFLEVNCTWPAADYLQLRGPGRGFLAAVLDAARLGNVSFWRSLQRAFADRYFPAGIMDGAGEFATLVTREARDVAFSNASRYVHPDLPSATDLPLGKLRQVQDLVFPLGYYDPYRRAATPEIVNPLLSQPLVELCLMLPTYLLTHGGRGRALARKAFADVIPPEIASRRSKGGMEEHVAAILQGSLPLARTLLLEGELARQGLLDRRRVEAALTGRPSAMDAYVSEIHNCIAVEAWLQRFKVTPGEHTI